MMRIAALLITLCLLLLMGGSVFAEDEQIFDAPGGANDPLVNDDANACFRGGTLAGKCSSTDVDKDGDVDAFDRFWMWNAGWHLIRFNAGMTDREDFEPYYAPILPKTIDEIEIEFAAQQPGCIAIVPTLFLNFPGVNILPTGTPFYDNASCTVLNAGMTGVPFVFAPDAAAALALCNTTGAYSAVIPFDNDVYSCKV